MKFVDRWERRPGRHSSEEGFIQGAKTESVLGELKKLSEERCLLFDGTLMREVSRWVIASARRRQRNRKASQKRRDAD